MHSYSFHGSVGKEYAYSAGDTGSTLGWEDSLEEEMAIHSSIIAWKILWTEEPGGLQYMGHKELDTAESQRHIPSHSYPCFSI